MLVVEPGQTSVWSRYARHIARGRPFSVARHIEPAPETPHVNHARQYSREREDYEPELDCLSRLARQENETEDVVIKRPSMIYAYLVPRSCKVLAFKRLVSGWFGTEALLMWCL
jgi:hypothetical protein